ncbi:MAG TPA: HAD-IIIA family hydrolase [Nitratidesulfovibrio sp.]|nr:HAD-IIIA family hydrolase [Nitratidesulfovibrio sp.]
MQAEALARHPAQDLARSISLLVLDVDGVMTDGGLYYDDEGRVTKRFNVQDGLGIKLAQAAGITVAVITGLTSGAVEARIRSLGIKDYHAGFLDKSECIDGIRRKYNLEWSQVAYLGDDWVDFGPLKLVGLPMAVANAQPEVKALARYVTTVSGGHGAVREVIRFLLDQQGVLNRMLESWPEQV